LAEGRK